MIFDRKKEIEVVVIKLLVIRSRDTGLQPQGLTTMKNNKENIFKKTQASVMIISSKPND